MTTAVKSGPRVQAKPERTSDIPRSPLVGLWDWRARNGHLFVSDTALRWHLRKHGDLYRKAGALLKINGRYTIDVALFERVLREVGQGAA